MGPKAGLSLLYSQFFVKLPIPTHSFSGQTIIITGSNTGLGLEGAKHIVRLDALKVILAVRNVQKGEDAKKRVEVDTGRKGVVEVWELDMAKYASVKAFARRASEDLNRLDGVILNAGISVQGFALAEGNESSITINVVSTFLLAILLLPTLRSSAETYHTHPVISVTSSSVHHFVDLTAKAASSIFATMNDPKSPHSKMSTRYFDSKLLEILYGRSFASAISKSASENGKPLVTLNMLNPGFCQSELFRDQGNPAFKVQMKLMGRTAEEGSRALVDAVGRGEESHGKYLSDCKVAKVSDFVLSKKGAETQERVWEELNAKLETVEPGIIESI